MERKSLPSQGKQGFHQDIFTLAKNAAVTLLEKLWGQQSPLQTMFALSISGV